MDNTALYRPRFRQERRLLCSEDSGFQAYYAFPSLLDTQEGRVLVCVKRGQKHWGDQQSQLLLLEVEKGASRALQQSVVYDQSGVTPQMGELARLPSGDICIYIDTQHAGTNQRTGMTALRSGDGGKTFGSPERVGVIDGVEYGYPMEMCTWDGVCYLAVMTFPNLQGPGRREVHVISSEDDGRTWRFAANLSALVGLPFNECSLICRGERFYLFTRGETDRRDRKNSNDDFSASQCLAVLDKDFRLIKMRDLHADFPGFSLTGRPRLQVFGGQMYLFTRQWQLRGSGRDMSMDCFRIQDETLEVMAHIRLDEPRFDGQDGHYPIAYLDDKKLCVVTYLSCPPEAGRDNKCDLVLFTYDMDEIAALGGGVT